LYALELENLTKQYAAGVLAVKGIDLKVKQGQFFALLGPNGAGKSTTIGIISSLVRKTSGTVKIFGIDIDTAPEEAKTKIGLVPQEFNFNTFEKVIDIVLFQAGFYGIPRSQAIQRAEIYLKKLGLWAKRKHKASSLSGGMKRRLMIARALIHEPEMLILDEPTAGVDIEIRRSTWDFLLDINQKGTTIILTTHYLEEAEYLCDGIAIIDKGQIVEDTTIKELLSRLKTESIILDTKDSIGVLPSIDGYNLLKQDDNRILVNFSRACTLNKLFDELSDSGIEIVSMRNKTNRLEELFMNLVQKND